MFRLPALLPFLYCVLCICIIYCACRCIDADCKSALLLLALKLLFPGILPLTPELDEKGQLTPSTVSSNADARFYSLRLCRFFAFLLRPGPPPQALCLSASDSGATGGFGGRGSPCTVSLLSSCCCSSSCLSLSDALELFCDESGRLCPVLACAFCAFACCCLVVVFFTTWPSFSLRLASGGSYAQAVTFAAAAVAGAATVSTLSELLDRFLATLAAVATSRAFSFFRSRHLLSRS